MQIVSMGYLVGFLSILLASGTANAAGEKAEQLQLVITADKPYYNAGDPISVAAEIKNTTKQDVFFLYCRIKLNNDLQRHRFDGKGGRYCIPYRGSWPACERRVCLDPIGGIAAETF